MTSFPITLPTDPKPSRIAWGVANVCAISPNPFTLRATAYQYAGDLWQVSVSLPFMDRATAAPWFAALASLQGRRGTFMLGDTLLASPRGTMAGSPKIEANTGGSFSLQTYNWTAGATIKAGDLVQVGNSLYMALADTGADAYGHCDFEVWPRCRGHAAETALVTSNAKCIFRLSDNAYSVIEADEDQLYSIAFTAEEAL